MEFTYSVKEQTFALENHFTLDKYYPVIKDRLLVYEDKSKADTILQYCKEHGINVNDIVYVDDVIPFLREAERKGIKSFHISSFLDWDYQ